ncbi:MAG: helix-turn-helix transcriptional regulator [Tissierellaceae bacterium]
MKVDKSLVSGSTSMLILSLLDEKDMYGYQMIEELEKRSNNIFELKAGTLYPLLHGLEKQGYLESYDGKAESNRPRKYYRLTRKGHSHLKDRKEEWSIFSKTINSIIGGARSEY